MKQHIQYTPSTAERPKRRHQPQRRKVGYELPKGRKQTYEESVAFHGDRRIEELGAFVDVWVDKDPEIALAVQGLWFKYLIRQDDAWAAARRSRKLLESS